MSKRLDIQAMQEITLQFYSHFCGTDLAALEPGMHFICSEERDKEVRGFGCKYAIFILVKDGLSVISYAPKHRDFVESLKGRDVEEIVAAVEQKHKLKHMRLLMFQGETVTEYGDAKILTADDYPLYEAFFRASTPSANPDGWLEEYLIEKQGKFAGYVKDGRLVSVCDAPDMPYMEGKIQHTGIKTLPEERRKGYAKRAAALATHQLIENGICPQWECDVSNHASLALAKSIGYGEFALAHILEE